MRRDIERKPITYQPVFAKVTRTNPELCRQMVERVLGRKVERLAFAQTEYDANAIAHRGVRFDVLLEGDDEMVEVEMQASGERALERCLRYYHAHIDQLLLDKGELIDELRPVYVIFFCLEDAFGAGLPKYTLRTRCLEEEAMPYDDGATSIVVAVPNFEREHDPLLATLMRYLLTSEPDASDPLTLELESAIDKAYRDESWVGSMLTYEQELALKEHRAELRGRDIGIAEGEARAKAEAENRYEALMAKLSSLGYDDAKVGALLRENSLDALFAKFDIA